MSQPAQTSSDTAKPALPLFRQEVLEARQAQWLGSIRIGRPLSFSVVTGASLAMAAALIAFACWGEVTRKATVHGVLLPVGGLLNVAAPQAGTIAEVLVREGEEVQAGQPLLRIKAERITAQGDAALLTAQALAARRTPRQPGDRTPTDGTEPAPTPGGAAATPAEPAGRGAPGLVGTGHPPPAPATGPEKRGAAGATGAGRLCRCGAGAAEAGRTAGPATAAAQCGAKSAGLAA
ncbi:biotin/lipoyl-binding protein [Roseateles sp. LKC17W]|uniref:biotin/lipoyl-binding protein n=1 Tax=Pelomonas margarita TaxID=3299031 RepID=UPI003748E457